MSHETNRNGRLFAGGAFLPPLLAVGLALLAAGAPAYCADDQAADAKKPAGQDGKPTPAPSFTDDDLKKYHRKPGEAPPDAEAAVDRPGAGDARAQQAAPGVKGAPGAKTAPAVPAAKGARSAKPGAPRPAVPAEDPLKPWKDKDALNGFRAEQIRTLRDRITALQSRLGYLDAKMASLENPSPLQAGRTVGPPPPKIDGTLPPPNIDPRKRNTALGVGLPALPAPPTDEDAADDKSMKTADLLDKIRQEKEQVTADLEAARHDLAVVESNFAQEKGAPGQDKGAQGQEKGTP